MMDTLLDKFMFWRSDDAGPDIPAADDTTLDGMDIDGCFTLPQDETLPEGEPQPDGCED